MRLITIYPNSDGLALSRPIIPQKDVEQFLWKMLQDRDSIINISHANMPTWNEHCDFIKSKPYRDWLIIEHEGKLIGQIYLTHLNEIGIHIISEERGHSFGSQAVHKLISFYGTGRYLANIAPANVASQDFFRSLGFKLIQYTFEFTMEG